MKVYNRAPFLFGREVKRELPGAQQVLVILLATAVLFVAGSLQGLLHHSLLYGTAPADWSGLPLWRRLWVGLPFSLLIVVCLAAAQHLARVRSLKRAAGLAVMMWLPSVIITLPERVLLDGEPVRAQFAALAGLGGFVLVGVLLFAAKPAMRGADPVREASVNPDGS